MSDADFITSLLAATHAAITSHADELTALDQAIGDGDHGINMSRGWEALKAEGEALAALDLQAALKKAGMTLVMKVGGASGPLYGTALMDMGKVEGRDAAELLAAGVEGVKRRGKSDAGAKTMLDVLVPVQAALADGARIAEVRTVTDAALEATRDMLATKGRAAFLGERSIGHIDPGARSSALLIHAVCDVLEGK